MLYVVIAYDGTEPGTFERRMQVRPAHMANGDKMMQDGSFLFASERTGWKHLYHCTADGKSIRPVTSGSWEVRGPGGGPLP